MSKRRASQNRVLKSDEILDYFNYLDEVCGEETSSEGELEDDSTDEYLPNKECSDLENDTDADNTDSDSEEEHHVAPVENDNITNRTEIAGPSLNADVDMPENDGNGGTMSDDETNVNIVHNISTSDSSSDEETITWVSPPSSFVPRLQMSREDQPKLLLESDKPLSELEMFLKFFPSSLINHIVGCTNDRLDILSGIRINKHKRDIPKTDKGELLILLGTSFIMSYNHLPELKDYWSKKLSLGNGLIMDAISRDRFCLLFSKLYFATPVKPQNATKIYYIEDLVECLRTRFQNNREDSCFQSIDESMCKFKGRSSLKQYMPMKPTKRGIKIWMRSDAKSGYIYDFSIYQGKAENSNDEQRTTLGERVVTRLLASVRKNPAEVTVAIDRFFTSVHLMNSLPFPLIGTFLKNRKNTPKFEAKKLKRGEYQFKVNNHGTFASRWQDCREVFVMANCYGAEVMKVGRKQKNGEKIEYDCPLMTIQYNNIMGGVDLSDQKISTYDLRRRSNKWWKKVFFRLLMASVVNAWIAYKEFHKIRRLKLKNFMVPLAEEMIREGIECSKRQRRQHGRPKDIFRNVWDHLPVEIPSRRRCAECAATKKKEKRVKTACNRCNVALCIPCFKNYHKRQ